MGGGGGGGGGAGGGDESDESVGQRACGESCPPLSAVTAANVRSADPRGLNARERRVRGRGAGPPRVQAAEGEAPMCACVETCVETCPAPALFVNLPLPRGAPPLAVDDAPGYHDLIQVLLKFATRSHECAAGARGSGGGEAEEELGSSAKDVYPII